MRVLIYVEGGGETPAPFRRAFTTFFAKIAGLSGRMPRVIACGGRDQAMGKFTTALTEHPDALVILLVDSEAPVAPGRTAWAHLKQRDNWERPSGVTDEQAHLMVECMEAWFLADRQTLAEYYGHRFRAAALPKQQPEQVPKDRLLAALQKATAGTSKGTYHKTKHGFDLLARIDPAKVRAASPRAGRLFDALMQAAASV